MNKAKWQVRLRSFLMSVSFIEFVVSNLDIIILKILGTACVTTYYCSLIALSIYYLVVSCYPVLPWTVCHDHLQASQIGPIRTKPIYICV